MSETKKNKPVNFFSNLIEIFKRLKSYKSFIIIGIIALIIFITIMIIFTDMNPIVAGSAGGVAIGFIISSLIPIIRYNKNNSDTKNKNKNFNK